MCSPELQQIRNEAKTELFCLASLWRQPWCLVRMGHCQDASPVPIGMVVKMGAEQQLPHAAVEGHQQGRI